MVEYMAHLGGQVIKKALFFARMSCYIWIESDFVDILIVVWKPFLN